MSSYLFIASDTPMDIIENPHYKQLSINEAISIGIEIPDILLKANVDPDKPDTILFCDFDLNINENEVSDGDADDNFALFPFEDTLSFCEMPYGVYIEWDYYTENSCKKIIDYIKNIMNKTNCVEIWKIWSSDSYSLPYIDTTKIDIDDLQAKHIKTISEKHCFEENFLPKLDSCYTVIHHCLRITK